MPHAAIYQRPERRAVRHFTVTVRTPEGRSTFEVTAHTDQDAKREAIRLYADEHDSPVTAWAEVH